MPETNSTVEITVAVSFYHIEKKKREEKNIVNIWDPKFALVIEEFNITYVLTSVPPMAGTMIKGMKISEPASDR